MGEAERRLSDEVLAELDAGVTPGPWCSSGLGDHVRVEHVKDFSVKDFSAPWVVCSMPRTGWLCEHDRHLLSAAPDLLHDLRLERTRSAALEAALGLRREASERAVVPSDLWQQTYSGLAFRPAAPHVAQIALVDIAHGLANTARYSGQTRRRYSVAEHSVHLARWFLQQGLREEARTALLHDAAEAYLCDIPRPLKALIAPLYKPIEARVEAVIAQRFGLASLSHPAVKAADDRILQDERQALLCEPPLPWTPREPLGVSIRDDMRDARWELIFLGFADRLGIVEVDCG